MGSPRVADSSVVPGWLSDALSWVGLRWPEGDATRLAAAGDAWLALARSLREVLRGNDIGADAAASRVWRANRGVPIEAFRAWWSAARGPSANLERAAGAAEKIGASLRGMSVQVALLKAAYVANLAALVAALAAAGFLIVGTAGLGTLAVAGGGTIAIGIARRAMVRALEAAVAAVTLQLVGVLLRRAADELVPAPAPTTARPQRDRRPQPDPVPVPVPFPIPQERQRDRRPRCEQRPGPLTPLVTGIPPGSLERLYSGTGLQLIDRQVMPDGSRQVIIEGVVRDPIPRSGFEARLAGLDTNIGLPPGEYQASHTWGPRFGSEAAAGIYLSPREANLSFQWRAERFVQELHQTTPPDGWVELRAVTATHPSAAFSGTGANLTVSTDYDVTVCRPGRVLETYNFGFEVGQPSVQSGTFRPGRVTIYGLP